MKCPGCQYVLVEAKANFCSNCGQRLQPAANLKDAETKSLKTDVDNAAENTGHLDSIAEECNKSPKRLNEEDSNPKRKRKKKKKSKKKKDGNLSSDTNQSDLSLEPPEDNNEKKRPKAGDGSDSDSSDNALDQEPKSLQDFSSVEHQSLSEMASPVDVPPGNTGTGDQSGEISMPEKQLPLSEPTEVDITSMNQTAPGGSAVDAPEDTQVVHDKPDMSKVNTEKQSAQIDQTQSQSEAHTTDDKSKQTKDITQVPQPGSDKGINAENQSNKKTNKKNSQNKKESDTNQQNLDQNANKESREKQTGESKRKKKNKQMPNQTPSESMEEDGTNVNAPDESTGVAPEHTKVATARGAEGNAEEQGDQTQSPSEASTADEKSEKTKENGQSQPPTHGKAPIAPQLDSEKTNNSTDNKTNKNSKNKKESDAKNQAKLDQNANEEGNVKLMKEPQQQKEKGKNNQGPNQTQTGKAQQMVFGPSTKTQSSGSSVDPPVTPEKMEVQQSESSQDPTKGQAKTNVDSTGPTEDTPAPKKPKKNTTIDAQDRLVIHFHAVLSKDFKFDPNKDEICVQAGDHIGSWDENIVVLNPTRFLENHGFLVEGELVTSKSNACLSIPYKYVIYRTKKRKYEYEYIYKLDSTDVTNRCLFVKDKLLTTDGTWHQYDDIICAEPDQLGNRFVNFVKEKLWPQQKKSLIEGREIAGQIMLESIFDLLNNWSDINVKNFLIQLNQFFDVYAEPSVYETKHIKWDSLGYGKEDVKKMLKHFMLHNMIPQLLKDREGRSQYVHDPLRAAIIMGTVSRQYGIPLDIAELKRLCTTLSLPKVNQEEFMIYWEQFSNDVRIFPNLTEMLMSLMNAAKAQNLPHWILVLPVVHLLKGNSKPYTPLLSGNQTDPQTWTGLEGIQNLQSIQHMTDQNRRSLLNQIKTNLHLKEIDVLTVRSWMYLLSLSELVECSIILKPELLDILRIFNLKIPRNISDFEEISKIIAHIQGNLIEEKYSPYTDSYRKQCMSVTVKILDKICKGVGVATYYYNNTYVFVSCMHLVASVSDFVSTATPPETLETPQGLPPTRDLLDSALDLVRTKISQSFRGSLLSGMQEFDMWNNVISVKFKDDLCTTEWREKLTKDFEARYKQESAMRQIEYYCTNVERLNGSHSFVAPRIEICALDAVTSLCQTRSEGKLLEGFALRWFGKFGKLISTIIEKSWPKDSGGNYCDDEETILQHLLSWTASKNIFQLYVGEDGMSEKLSEVASERIAIAISAFTSIVNQLVHGDIKIKLLNIILEKKVAFSELIQIDCLTEKSQYKNVVKMRRLLQQRQDEVRAVYHEKELVDILVTMSHNLEEILSVDVADIKEKQQVNIEEMILDNFMDLHPFDQISSGQAGAVTYFNLDEDIRDMAEKMHTFRDSHMFRVCWEQHVKAFVTEENSDDEDDVSLEKIYEEIFVDSFKEYKEIYSTLKDGSITLQKINDLTFRGKYEELEQDLEIMCRIDGSADKLWIRSRVQQIEEFHELHLAVASAEIIMEVKRSLHLQGDFSILETLLKVNQTNLRRVQLQQIDNDMVLAKKDLVDITKPRQECLQELIFRGNFVSWVKEALADINELKVFVDLASISAGENDMDVDRVACFHDAVLGYSSLLYELRPDSDFHHFKTVVQKLWRALDNDSNLPKKMRDSARHLVWLKTVKDCHGSVELSSLSLASSINKKGIYIISAQAGKKLSLEKALKLRISEEHDGGETRNYSLEDLRELQNKLMLMSGKGDQGQHEVDQFTEVFDSVQRLSEAFIALYTAGNPLFRHWEAQISCCANSHESSIMMDFNLGGAFSAVIIEGSIEEQLPDLCRKMEKCLEFWKDFVDKQRSQHYYLNYYTAEQMVRLCSRLSQDNVPHLDDQTLMMLSFVKTDCSAADLRQVWHELQYDLLNQPPEQNDNIEFQTFTMLETEFSDVTSEFDLLPSLIQQRSGLHKFDLLWNTYMKDMKRSLPDILDLGTLGRLLEILGNRMTESGGESEEDISDDNVTKCICRELPNGLTNGKPNLVVCPHENILTSCISTYMTSKNEPLPTQDEVLLCTSTTPYEQVELFLRRCLSPGYRGYKLYSLVYADVLTYDVSSKVESFFQSLKMKSRNDYRLVIFCSSEREHAYLPSAFSQYKVHMVPQAPLARIQEYLHRHYVVPEDQCSAAAVFKDRLCVGIVSSRRAGVGKSLYIKRLFQKLKHSTKKTTVMNCIRLIEPTVDENAILQSLRNIANRKALSVFHFDVTSSVKNGLHEFLFKLLFLRYLMDFDGKVWKCNEKQLYVVEILEQAKASTRQAQDYSFTDVFPNIFCRPPKEALEIELQKTGDPNIFNTEDPLMDDEEFRSAAFQRPYQYLTRFHNHADLDKFTYYGVEGTHDECLQMLLIHCGIMDPSWAELRNFAWFLNLQLQDCETSVFCNAEFTGDTLIGFKRFVVDFMILMAKDFATPSLSISDQSPGRSQMDLTGVRDEDLAPFLIRKRWETEPHPYIFFNDDHVSMTFIGFHLQPNDHNSVNAIDPASGRVIKRNVMTKQLYDGLNLQRVPFNIDFDRLPRGEKIERMCNVLGIQWPLDPDETYELTTDNILKILAIHMRFRCGIPVIIMGETGCGKTRLIKFLCELRKSGVGTENMKLVKVHGGTSSDMIYTKVKDAETMAAINKQDYGFDSVLFFDEANTTDAISSIKEVLCDRTVKGQGLTPGCGLQIIAACNPYRKHTEQMIERLELAGLGYRVRAEETDEKLGSIPLRQLVYRVHALPPSMIPLVWDFGQLNNETEKKYIQQIVQRVVESHAIDAGYIECIVNVLSASQQYMRKRKDECSFVSLRDVERCMQAFAWFLDHHDMFFADMEALDSNHVGDPRDPVLWSLVMATGVCYQACLENKDSYRQEVSRNLPRNYTPGKIKQEITLMQDLLLRGVPMGDTIAKNDALKENVFMMVLCIELRIPLFLVGKPGSSKSLSKTLVADAMQGQAAHSDLYKRLKQIHLVSFQCSPHSTPDGIINTFKQCGRFQEGKNLNEYISVVVLDEIGLAEDSPKMPLKTLHPLLEEGCIDDEPLPHKKVGFIGISNWALDPAKMNRGIFVSRGDPDKKELVKSAKGICSSDLRVLEDFFQPFAEAYLDICRQGNGFFGLRDYYSLIKMIFAVAKTSQRKPSSEEIMKAVLRNFSGRDDVDAVAIFKKNLQIIPKQDTISAIDFIKENIQAIGQDEECRYLLVLTKNYAALQILQQTFFKESDQPEIIFGSSFPKDQEYTQICRNINRVKICMETGQTIVLLNLQNLYESLYDALNQYYVFLGGQKYVDLGLGTHRVKCRVHKDFRLIVIEEREIVYKQFPIPLINRLEKHFLDINTVLKAEQRRLVSELEKWVELFVSFSRQQTAMVKAHKYKPAEVFIGYHSDTCASVVLQVLESQNTTMETSNNEQKVLEEAKLVLLNCATPDSVVRLDCSELPKGESEHLTRVYSEEQNSGCLSDYILAHIREEQPCSTFFTEVTTFSRLLTASDLRPLEQMALSAELLSVQQFDTEHSFLKKIRNFLTAGQYNSEPNIKILIIQCDYDDSPSANLIASAKYSSINEIRKVVQQNVGHRVFVYFISRLPRMIGGTSYVGFHGGPWKSVHIDDLRRSNEMVSDIKTLQRTTLSQLFEANVGQPEAMEVDDSLYMETEQENTDFENDLNKDLVAVLDTTSLLRSCVQSAVGMLRDQLESGFRSTQRVEILLTLLDDNNEMQECFNKIVKRHLHDLLAMHVDNNLLSSNWVMKEASNVNALQEGGTFRNTLWKRVQAVVVPMLAHLLTIIDRDKNLDILLDENCGTSVKRLWLDIFGNDKFLEIPQLSQDRNSESRTILVQNHITEKMGIGCSLPFSWRIRDYLEDLWVHAHQHEGQTPLQFDDFFWKTPLGRFIVKEDQDTQTEFYHRYLQDFVSLTMNVTCKEEMQLLCGALNCCVNELKMKLEATDRPTSLSWIHAAYHEFKNRLQNLSRMLCIEPRVTGALLRNPSFKDGPEMVLDVYVAFACVERLEPTVLDTDDQRQTWLRQVHKLQVPIELVCSEDSVQHYGERSRTIVRRVQDAWNRIFCLSLFVEHMMLGIEDLEHKLVPVVLEHTRRLWQILENNTNLKTKDSFEAVIGLLKICKDGAVEHIFRFGLPRCSVCIGDPQDPICLPCHHIYCLACIRQWLVPGQMYCPYCMQPVDDDFAVVPSDAIRVKINQHAQFRKRCNAFFVELVSSMCFKDNIPPSSAVIHALLSFLMPEAHPAPIPGASRERQIRTKEFSPFDESYDKSPVVRSVVLKLLLKYSFDKIKKYLQHHLHSVEQSNLLDVKEKIELYSLYLNCLEDSMFEKLSLKYESDFLAELLTDHQSLEAATVDCLQQVARVRLDLDMAADLITEETLATVWEGQTESSVFLKRVKDFCTRSGNNWYRVYLIRKIASQHGVEHVQNLLKVQQMSWIFPEEILQKAEETTMDQFLVCGVNYQAIRNAVAKVVMDGTVDDLDETCGKCKCSPQCRAVYLLLALYREVTSWYQEPNTRFHPKPQQMDIWMSYIQQSKVLTTPELKAFAQALVTNQLGPLSLRPGVSRRQCVFVELTVHLAAVLLCGNNGFLGPLKQLALAPATMQAAYLPSMPEDMLAVAQQAMGHLHWYRCPNGHYCTIGECGRPMELSRCVDCGSAIGGVNHMPAQGFQAAQLQGDRTQTGHILGDPMRRDNPDMMDTKSFSPVPFAVMRMVTHLAMFFGLCKHAQTLSTIIKPQVPNPMEFLLAHLKKDQTHLGRSLGKGADDTISSVHLFISCLLQPQQQQTWPVGYDNQLSSKEARNHWETQMSSIFAHHLKNLDRQLQEVNILIHSDDRISASPIMKVLFGDPQLFLGNLPENSLIHCSTVWSCREKVSLLGLTHILEQNDGKDTLPVLWKFLHREAEYRLVKFLPDILALQKNLVKKFQNVGELGGTITEFLQNQTSALKAWYEKHINIFLSTWNQLRVFLATNGEIKLPPAFSQKDLDLSCDFTLLLPSRRIPGLCSTALVSYLIALHNDLVYSVDKLTGEETSYKVSPADLTDLHVIRYELDRDLMPLVLSNTQYSIEKGQETLHEYDLPKTQQQIISRFLLGKPLITLNGIPTLVNRHDRNYEVILKDVKTKIMQEPLQTLTQMAVSTQLDSYNEVCDALSTVEISLGFLAMTGGDPSMQLSCYLEEVLKMGNQTPPHILKALSVCSLKHCAGLWQLLGSLKSEGLLKLKRDPFGDVSKEYKQALGVNERTLLTGFFSKNSADSFLLEMHEFLVLVLNKPNATETFKPEWGLKDTLVSYMERKDLDAPPDVEELFPEEICLSHYVETWKFCVSFKQERAQRL